MKDSFYVDDLITGEGNDDKAFNAYKKSNGIMAMGGFILRKWHLNSRNLLKLIESGEIANNILGNLNRNQMLLRLKTTNHMQSYKQHWKFGTRERDNR